jgi:hypothetical protein
MNRLGFVGRRLWVVRRQTTPVAGSGRATRGTTTARNIAPPQRLRVPAMRIGFSEKV